MMLLSYGASWVGQAYAGQPHHLTDMIAAAIAHRGFSYLHILSPCVTFDKTSMTYQNLGMAVRDLPRDHDPTDLMAAMAQAMDTTTPGARRALQPAAPDARRRDGRDHPRRRRQALHRARAGGVTPSPGTTVAAAGGRASAPVHRSWSVRIAGS